MPLTLPPPRAPRLERSPQPYHRRQPSAATSTTTSRAPSPGSSRLGTPTDDELAVKALPAPPSRYNKGLKTGGSPDSSLATTPAAELELDFGANGRGHVQRRTHSPSAEHKRKRIHDLQTSALRKRRRTEVCRRAAEAAALMSICAVVVWDEAVSRVVTRHARGVFCTLQGLTAAIASFAWVLAGTLVAYVLSLYWPRQPLDYEKRPGVRLGRVTVPVSFDPAPLFYPPLLPLLVALSLASRWDGAVVSSMVLGISSLPTALLLKILPGQAAFAGHWLLTLIPCIGHRDAETLSLLYPLHQSILQPLHYATTTSLLPAELQLLASTLVSLQIHAATPQNAAISILLWTGGAGAYVLCWRAVTANVQLERVPVARVQRAARALSAVAAFKEGSRPKPANGHASGNGHVPGGTKGIVEAASRFVQQNTSTPAHESTQSARLSSGQLSFRKWAIAIYCYTCLVALILLPIRAGIARHCLDGHEPFGWAVGYLFGEFDFVRDAVLNLGLGGWVYLPAAAAQNPLPPAFTHLWVEHWRLALGPGLVRLALLAYWVGVIAIGLLTVLFVLPALADVDTRRKVFHGTMVAVLLPTTFADPCYLALGLSLVLAVFLLLDLIRAAQLRPLSKPIAHFLAPYVDGRDLRGPVVVSHIFLLIGCAIPFWLSMAAYDRPQHDAFPGWQLRGTDRDVSMVAGVVCVGLGDAAASLIGRRFGRHKWPWRGGKSLEGSAAFALAVTAGLVAGKAWLVLGGWAQEGYGPGVWASVAGKSLAAATGASFTEAVLTGANDNVVVPVVLWLLVRGLNV